MPITRIFAGRLAVGAAMFVCLIIACRVRGVVTARCDCHSRCRQCRSSQRRSSDSAAAVLAAYQNFGGKIVALDANNPTTTTDCDRSDRHDCRL